MDDKMIALPCDRPPMVVSAPCDMRGLIWSYWPADRQHAAKALAIHARDWEDWSVDQDLVALAGPAQL